MNERAVKTACFCGYLKDRPEKNKNSQSTSMTSTARLASTACTNGLAGTYPCKDVDLQSFLPLSVFDNAFEANDVWGWTDTATGREFALLGLTDGTGFVEITDPVNPVYVGKLPTATSSSAWRDIKTYNNHAFVVSEASGHGMQVFDLTQLLTAGPGSTTFSSTATYTSFGNAHNIVINEDTGFAYAVGSSTCSGGLHMIDISTPTSPTFAGCYSGDGYVHDAHCVVYIGTDTTYTGKEICFCSNEDTITIVDVTIKASPVQLSRTSYPSDGYTHQGWLSEDQAYLIFGDETDEQTFGFQTKTLVMDVASLTAPFLAGAYFGPTAAIDHNLYNIGGITFLSSYRAGLRILRIDDLSTASFSEIGFFDIYPGSDSANFNGAWSVYPFFPSGNVVVSGIEQGLFVLMPDLTAGPICNNNGVCDAGEDCNNCSSDCASRLGGNPNRRFCCDGDVAPDCGSSECSCALNSGPTPTPPAPTPTPPAPTPTPPACGGNKASCSSNADCCSFNCNGRVCRGGRRLGGSFDEVVHY